MKSVLGLVFGIIISGSASAQVIKNGKISISVNNHLNLGLENTTVELLRSKDSGLVKSAITDKSGVAVLEKLAAGTYITPVFLINRLNVEIWGGYPNGGGGRNPVLYPTIWKGTVQVLKSAKIDGVKLIP